MVGIENGSLFYFCNRYQFVCVFNETSGIRIRNFLPNVLMLLRGLWSVVGRVYSWSRIKESTILYSNGFDYHLV